MAGDAKTKSHGIVSWPEEERPRERLLSRGPQAMTDAELLAIVLRVGYQGTNAVELGRQLLQRFGSLRAMAEAPLAALMDVKGLKGAKAAQVSAAMEIARRVSLPDRSDKTDIRGTQQAARILFPPEKREYELVYHGKQREEDILADTMGLPLQPVRTFGAKGGDEQWRNMLIFGDNLQVMKSLLEMKKSGKLRNADGTPGIRLVYIDPPFATKRDFQGSREEKAYRDKITGKEFLEFLRKRIVLIRQLLSDDATVYVHLDTKKSHAVKMLMDELFGEGNFCNEVIWQRTNARSTGTQWPRVHDSLLVYRVGSYAPFNPQLAKADSKKLPHTLVTGVDGKKYQTFELTAPGVTKSGESGRPWRGFNPSGMGRHWGNNHSVMDQWDAEGLIHWPTKGGFPRRRAAEPFDPETRRVTVGDVWTDIDRINQAADERSGYPTQKPEDLLARILNASSNHGDVVLDAFAGSGTTIVVAEKLERRWIAVDCGKLAVYTMQDRLLSLRKEVGGDGRRRRLKPFTLYNAGLYDFSRLRELPWESWRFFALQLFQCCDQPHRIGGIDLDGRLKGASVLVFNHMKQPGVRIDEETIESLHQALGSKVGSRLFIIAPALTFDFQQDYIDQGDVRYYALRIPYSIIHELHNREFTALKQPADEMQVNDTVEAVGFDFIRTPELRFSCGKRRSHGQLFEEAYIRVTTFKSEAMVGNSLVERENLEMLSMVMLDYDYDEANQVFDLDAVFYGEAVRSDGGYVRFRPDDIGDKLMAVFIDIYGNEARVLIDAAEFEVKTNRKKRIPKVSQSARSSRSKKNTAKGKTVSKEKKAST